MTDPVLLAKLLWCIVRLRQGEISSCIPVLMDVAENLRDRLQEDRPALPSPSGLCCEEELDEPYIWDRIGALDW